MKPASLIVLLLGVTICLPKFCLAETGDKPEFQSKPVPGRQVAQRLVHAEDSKIWIEYLVFVPEDYDGKSEKRWPVIFFLHGAGKRGGDVRLVAGTGPPKLAAENTKFPYIVVSPQCPADTWWEFRLPQLDLLLNQLPELLAVDKDRIYLTGLSAGGFGSWRLAAHRPETFAAVMPICGGLNPPESHGKLAPKLKHIPIWAFHGDADKVVPLRKGKKIVDLVNKLGGNARLTVYPNVGHDAWTETYANKELYQWLNKQSLSTRSKSE